MKAIIYLNGKKVTRKYAAEKLGKDTLDKRIREAAEGNRIDPYEQQLRDLPAAQRRAWGEQVVRELKRMLKPGDKVIILARMSIFSSNILRNATALS